MHVTALIYDSKAEHFSHEFEVSERYNDFHWTIHVVYNIGAYPIGMLHSYGTTGGRTEIHMRNKTALSRKTTKPAVLKEHRSWGKMDFLLHNFKTQKKLKKIPFHGITYLFQDSKET